MRIEIRKGAQLQRNTLLRDLTVLQYKRNDFEHVRGTFRVRGDVVDVFPTYEDVRTVRIEFFGDEVDRIAVIDPLTGEETEEIEEAVLLPASHYVQPKERMVDAADGIEQELLERLQWFRDRNKVLEAARLE